MAGLTGAAVMANPVETFSKTINEEKMKSEMQNKWLDGSRLVVSVSMQFEAGGQPENAESPFPQNMQKGYIDQPALTWYQYGHKEGIPRMLDNWDKHGIKVTSHMVWFCCFAKSCSCQRNCTTRSRSGCSRHELEFAICHVIRRREKIYQSRR